MNNSRWQFSVRFLLVLTAILSFVLAFAVKLPDVFQILLVLFGPVLLLAAMLKSANFLTSERRPLLSAISWSMLAAFFGVYVLGLVRLLFLPWPGDAYGLLLGIAIMVICFLACAIRTYRSYQLVGHWRPDTGSESEQLPPHALPAEPQKE